MNRQSLENHFRSTQGNPSYKVPVLFNFVHRIEKTTLTTDELSKLQIAAEPKLDSDGKINPTYTIFELLGTTSAMAVADAYDYLIKNGSEDVKKWFSTIDCRLEELIQSGFCPAIIVSPRMIHCGEIPDGNHRTLTALRLANQEKVTLPAYRLHFSTYGWALYNSLIFIDRMRSNPVGTMKVARERLK